VAPGPSTTTGAYSPESDASRTSSINSLAKIARAYGWPSLTTEAAGELLGRILNFAALDRESGPCPTPRHHLSIDDLSTHEWQAVVVQARKLVWTNREVVRNPRLLSRQPYDEGLTTPVVVRDVVQ